jgi:hypothetical protein
MEKKVLFLVLVFTIMFISGCTQDLPPEPGSPGAIGKAVEENWWTSPVNFFVESDPLFFEIGTHEADQKVLVEADYIYHKGYYLSRKNNHETGEWISFEFSGDKVQNWIKNSAIGYVSLRKEDIFDENFGGNILAYSCNRISGGWDCHNSKWMMYEFDTVFKECENYELRCVVYEDIETELTKETVEECEDYKWTFSHYCNENEICEYGKCVEDLPPEPPIIEDIENESCYDSDGGINIFIKGKASSPDGSFAEDICVMNVGTPESGPVDSCEGDDCYLYEGYCDNGELKRDRSIQCPFGCKDGACVSVNGIYSCSNSDGGFDKETVDLSDYPSYFYLQGKFNGYIVYPTQAYPFDMYYDMATSIAESLNTDRIVPDIFLNYHKNINNYNIISIGNPCFNTVSAEIKGTPAECIEGIQEGHGYIRLFENNRKAHIIIEGYDDFLHEQAVKVLLNIKDYPIDKATVLDLTSPSSTEIQVTSNNLDLTVPECECNDGFCLQDIYSCFYFKKDIDSSKFFKKCINEGYDNVCLNKFTGEFQGCTFDSYNECTEHNANANQNILCELNGCIDSDGGVEPFNNGEVYINKSYIEKDLCLNKEEVSEKYCYSGRIDLRTFTCPGICEDGACLSKETFEKCVFPTGLDCIDKPRLCADVNQIAFKLKNNLGFDIEILDIDSQNCTYGQGTLLIENSESTFLTLNCNDMEPGKMVDKFVEVKYKNLVSNLTHLVVGEIEGYSKICESIECTDSDGGKDLYKKGIAKGTGWGTDSYVEIEDYCIKEGPKEGRLAESHCIEGYVTSSSYECPNGCDDGACLNVSLPDIVITKFSLNKTMYYVNETIPIFGYIKNNADLDISTPAHHNIYVNGEFLSGVKTTWFLASMEKKVGQNWVVTEVGNYTATLIADEFNNVTESDENNNQETIRFIVVE